MKTLTLIIAIVSTSCAVSIDPKTGKPTFSLTEEGVKIIADKGSSILHDK